MIVDLVIQLLAGQNNLRRVDDDDVIAAVHMRGEGRLVLAAQDRSNLAGQSAKGHAVGVNDIPVALDVLGICHKRFHVNFLLVVNLDPQ